MTDQERQQRINFATLVSRFDWYYGRKSLEENIKGFQMSKMLDRLFNATKCPFTWIELHAWTGKFIVEDFRPGNDESGEWFYFDRQPAQGGVKPDRLITRARHKEITAWMSCE